MAAAGNPNMPSNCFRLNNISNEEDVNSQINNIYCNPTDINMRKYPIQSGIQMERKKSKGLRVRPGLNQNSSTKLRQIQNNKDREKYVQNWERDKRLKSNDRRKNDRYSNMNVEESEERNKDFMSMDHVNIFLNKKLGFYFDE